MKPEKLIICGWGPYKEEAVIDFKQLNNAGLFLVTGQTGAGKTTIFDAIAYALYGVLSGEVREKGSVRSDFADADTKTYVELYMRHKNEVYHISRNPEYLRPKKRKSGENAFTKEKENAVLTMPDGTIIAGNQDVTAKMEELLHMDGRQFRQISMIAQGEFSKMLFASPAEKNAIFRELFGTGIYAQIQAELKSRSANLYREYMVFKHKMEEDVRLLVLPEEEWSNLTSQETLDFEGVIQYLAKRLEKEKKDVKTQKKEAADLEKKLLILQKEMESVRQINARFKELEETKQKSEELAAKKPQMDQLKEQIQTAKKAQVLLLEEKVILEKEQTVTEVSKRIESLETEVSELCKQEKELESIVKIKDAAEEAYGILKQLQEKEKLLKQQENEQKRLQEKLTAARAAYEKAQKDADEKRRRYEEADVRYKKAVIGIAAKLVKAGEPCPVCGSMEHPHIAQISEEVPDEKQLEQWKKEAEKSRAEADRCYEQALFFTNEEKHLMEAGAEAAKCRKDLQEKLSVFDEEVLAYISSHTEAELDYSVERNVEIQAMLLEKRKSIKESRHQEKKKKQEAKESRGAWEKKIREHGFLDVSQYKQAQDICIQLENLEKKYRNYEEAVVSVENLQEHLQNSLKDLQPGVEDVYKEQFNLCQLALQECRRQMEEKNVLISQITRSLLGIQKNRMAAETIQKEYGIVKDLDDLANGNNARRLVFEQYVLAGYFENILKAANIRLRGMTEGRYELLRAGQVSDGRKKDNLEILVMDYYTGRKRSVKTLSGGETFKASLALALGMSDCIQAQNGGMEVETLFIDEGFGALDEESLEQACTTLQTLAGKNRMIGVISHVAQLRERIEGQIIIEKYNSGSVVKVRRV